MADFLDATTARVVRHELSGCDSMPQVYYRKRNCDTGMTANTEANRYQKQKIIQNTVRLPANMHTDALAALTAYSNPIDRHYGVYWNQMSDQAIASVARSRPGMNVPGGQAVGGVGTDVKYGSYARYMRKIKGKGPLRRGASTYIPPEIPFSRTAPIYGGKVVKTAIIGNARPIGQQGSCTCISIA